MSKIILTIDALSSIIENVVLNIEGVKGLYGKSPVKCVFEDSIINVEVNVVARFDYDLRNLGNLIAETVKLEVENITPFKVSEIIVIFGDISYES
ncbi:hypothetical protein [Caldisericum exile]|uniref:Asp23/Gls24 family envelope stress response protein n=1 Tax=Caldisericum exile (strain DSM 21853 / NBRC 104410 / AZM16c01) TaxID=511051 RepID=A0A7U6GEH2_CALEA|nr:hypothetical protein [Caldisericum exile]BAL80910.1 hypothetical protein CSE_07840 [Caldisericum exile AZM16c01]